MNAFIAAIFLYLLTFLLRGGSGLDLRVLIEVTWPRRLCHKKEQILLCLAINIFPFLLPMDDQLCPPSLARPFLCVFVLNS